MHLLIGAEPEPARGGGGGGGGHGQHGQQQLDPNQQHKVEQVCGALGRERALLLCAMLMREPQLTVGQVSVSSQVLRPRFNPVPAPPYFTGGAAIDITN
jgi:hypothetical protein